MRVGLAELEEHDVPVRQRHGQAARLGAQRHLLDGQRRVFLVARGRAARAPLEYCNRPNRAQTANKSF